ncbi:hypothetical protein SHEEN_82 [Mycobacterium phage Sheen]|uniref:Uncharacterized protein n=1 Tax=Mycobacterium phage Sheen TaxID=1589274 RepID=A0A0B5A4A4_9CAUD|nr:hypothetical protein AVV31_gp12 [Mycobacterium phage Sheen]AJD82500.1 hypothetical protein SHEEN_82 [Mycobacterium phage Sheen]
MITKVVIPNASVDPLGRELDLVLTPNRWEYVLHTDN